MGVLQAAVLALVLAGVAGAAIPGSPLRLWLESTFGEEEVETPVIVVPAPQQEAPVAPAPVTPEVVTNEVTATPVDGRVVISLHEPPAGVRLIVRVADGNQATVEAVASPTARPGGVVLTSIGGDRIVVTLPRTIVSARIEVDGVTIVHREGESFTQLPAQATPSGDEIVIVLER
jgi:hypothetical protein